MGGWVGAWEVDRAALDGRVRGWHGLGITRCAGDLLRPARATSAGPAGMIIGAVARTRPGVQAAGKIVGVWARNRPRIDTARVDWIA